MHGIAGMVVMATYLRVKLRLGSEVQQQADLEVRRSQIAVHLSCSGFVEFVRRFDFHDKLVVHHYVKALSREFFAFVHHTNGKLARDSMTSGQQFSLECHRVDVFVKAKPQGVVNLVKRSDHRMRQLFFDEFSTRHRAKLSLTARKTSSKDRQSRPFAGFL
jgi:hypothetical protein